MSPSTSSPPPLKIGPLFNHFPLLPPKQAERLDLTADKTSRLSACIRSFARRKDEISFELWRCLQRHNVVNEQDCVLYMDNLDQEGARDVLARFHEAVTPYVASVDPQKGTLSIDPPLMPIRFILS